MASIDLGFCSQSNYGSIVTREELLEDETDDCETVAWMDEA